MLAMTLVEEASQQVSKREDLERRKEFALLMAQEYNIRDYRMVLMLTHPELAKLTLPERCAFLGMSEEEAIYGQLQAGYKRFAKEYQGMMLDVVRAQSLNNMSAALKEPRFIHTKEAVIPDFKLESTVVEGMREPAQNNVQVNVQTNVWEDAMKRAGK